MRRLIKVMTFIVRHKFLQKIFRIGFTLCGICAFSLFYTLPKKEPSQTFALATLPGYEEDILGESTNKNTPADNDCGCSDAQVVGTGRDLSETDGDLFKIDYDLGGVEEGVGTGRDLSEVENCTIKTSITTSQFHIFTEDDKVVIDMKYFPDTANVRAAYEFLMNQNCSITDENLEWRY